MRPAKKLEFCYLGDSQVCFKSYELFRLNSEVWGAVSNLGFLGKGIRPSFLPFFFFPKQGEDRRGKNPELENWFQIWLHGNDSIWNHILRTYFSATCINTFSVFYLIPTVCQGITKDLSIPTIYTLCYLPPTKLTWKQSKLFLQQCYYS